MPKLSKKKRNRKEIMENVNEILRRKRSVLHEINENKLENHVQHDTECSQSRVDTNVTITSTTKNIMQRQGNEVVINMVHEDEAIISTNELNQNIENENQQDELDITTEKEQIEEHKHVGRRIVNVSHFTQTLLDFCNHGPLGCTASDIVLTGEKRNGLMSKFTFKCKMCNVDLVIENDTYEDNYLNLNTCAVAGTVATGCGRSQLEEILSAMNMPSLTEHVYDINHQLIGKHWESVATNEMLEAGKREKEIAVAEGNVDENGHGVVDVVVDGCWCKRSYKKNYSAFSGAAAIIGKNTGEILYLGIKNKYCQVCATAQKAEEDPKEHMCFKNYDGPSTGMESSILVEGFKSSIEQHGLVYGRLISDGDASTHSKILEARPYENKTVEKVECRNHVMRNFCNKLQALTTETKYLLRHRKCVTQKVVLAIRCTIIKSIKKHKHNSDVELLHDDILRSHTHGFGDHSRCKDYFCTRVGVVNKENIPDDFFTSALWQRICFLVQGVAAHSRSLIYDVDSNRVESFHSVVAKFVGGKRVNFSKKNSYQMRVHAAAVSFNKKKTISKLYKSINGGNSPTGKLRWMEEIRKKKADYNRRRPKTKRRLFNRVPTQNKDYGEGCVKPDLDEETYNKVKDSFLTSLRKTEKERDIIQKSTILQSESGEWMELRRSLLTASNFGKIIKRRNDTSCANTVKDFLYKAGNLSHVSAIKHGRENEKIALNQLSTQLNKEIKKCGLFIDKELPFLGATPDGLCDDDMVVEVKCPITAHVIGVEEAIKNKKITFWKNNKNGEQEINKNHNWYYQVQGQLRITQRSKCIFAVWAKETEPLKVELIEKDDNFWKNRMEEKLSKFYMDCLLPELVDPRHPRNLQIRDPLYIEEEIKKKKAKESKKQAPPDH